MVIGTGFATFTLSPPIHTVCLGICMDLNRQIGDWTLSKAPYEIASHSLSNKANVLILLNAWLDSGVDLKEAHDWSTLNFWASRLRPLWASDEEEDHESETLETNGVNESESKAKETIVVICNRCGEENGKFFCFVLGDPISFILLTRTLIGKTFAGSSAIFSMRSGSGSPTLLDMMERREEGVRIWDVQV
jgi:protein N-terminal amidase